ncbi:MAG: aspartate/glutamate racemase family protein [Proteobacteria bacterium]|nr:aspartate/glutamate racemase family protein [Pseudomonadota bacterium]
MIEHLPFSTGPGIGAGIGSVARIGLVVLASDHTMEHEFRRVFNAPGFGPGVDYYAARIRNSPRITPATLAAMGPLLTDTVDLILPGAELDVVAFGCTSASMVLGEEAVAERIHAARPGAKATNPISAAFAAFEALGARRIAVLTPYRADLNAIVRDYITAKGYDVPVFGSFNEQDDAVVASIDTDSLRRAVRTITQGREVDAVFVSCTSVRLLDAVCEIEAETGLPVTSSNHALAWHCLRLAGVEEKRPDLGRLFEL